MIVASIVGSITVLIFAPETKNLTLEEIGSKFGEIPKVTFASIDVDNIDATGEEKLARE